MNLRGYEEIRVIFERSKEHQRKFKHRIQAIYVRFKTSNDKLSCHYDEATFITSVNKTRINVILW